MSVEGRALFDRYVDHFLNDPTFAPISVQSHVFNLLEQARKADIPRSAITEEVGPLFAALGAAAAKREK